MRFSPRAGDATISKNRITIASKKSQVKPRHKRKRKINDRFKVSLHEPKVFGSENRIEFHFEAKALAYVKQKKKGKKQKNM